MLLCARDVAGRVGRLEQRPILAVPLTLQFGDRDEAQCGGVHAVPLTSRRGGAIIENMTEVAVGSSGPGLRAGHPQRPVRHCANCVRRDRPGEAWPPGAAVVLVGRREQWLAGDHIYIDPGLVVVPVLVTECRFRPVLLRHAELAGGEATDRLRSLRVVV